MKKYFIPIALSAFFTVAQLIMLNGCKTADNAINTSFAAETAAQQAAAFGVSAWTAYIPIGHPSSNDQYQAIQALSSYKAAETSAIQATWAAANYAGTNEVANANDQAAQTALNKSLISFMTLLTNTGAIK